jgi:hypothetical protein
MKGADVVNILILGGLFALGIVAILGVLLLGRGEQRQHTARANGTGGQAPSPVEPDPTSMPEVPVTSRSQRLTIPLDRTPTLVGLDEQSASVRLNQQFHELADEIRALHQHAWDLEQRLSALTEMVDHVERVQNGHTSVEEEQSLL